MNTSLKMKIQSEDFFFKVLASLTIFITPIVESLIAVAILIIVDTITGIWASFKKGEKFKSNKFFDSIVKLIAYTGLLLISKMVENALVSEIPFVKLSLYYIVFYEFSSFLENVGVITGRDIFSWFKQALLSLKPNRSEKEEEPIQGEAEDKDSGGDRKSVQKKSRRPPG